VFNQGNKDARNIQITDYIPEGLEVVDQNWTISSNKATRIITETLAPNASKSLTLQMRIKSDFRGNEIINLAEISKDNAAEYGLVDRDSTPDQNKDNDCLQPLEPDLVEHTVDIHKLIQGIYNPRILEEMVANADTTKIKENPLNDNFYKQEFQKLWKCINRKYTYTVDFDSTELINKSINHIDNHLFVTTLQYTVTTGIQDNVLSTEVLKSGQAFKESNMESQKLTSSINSSIKYDLIGKVATLTNLTRKTVVKILKSINPDKFALFKMNPEEFISKVSSLINEQKATMIVEDITYNLTDKVYESEIFTAEKYKDYTKAIKSSKHIQDYIFTDGLAENSVENRFAKSLELDSKVVVYAKLPRGFKIPTPVGNYTPDWAIAFEKDSVKHIFFIAETKGDMSSLSLRPIEQAKISCAKKLFSNLSNQDLVYHEVDSYENLMAVMESI